jgi:transcriptional regulatory protein RtcR
MGNRVIQIISVESGISSITEISNDSICNKVIKNSPYVTLNSETVEQGSHNILRKYLDEDMLTTIDPFDAVQLAYVIEVCISYKNQAAAGRYLYANSRDKLKSPNDSDRLRKYLMKFGLRFDELKR